MSNRKIQYQTAFAIQFNEMMDETSKEMKYLDLYKLKKSRLNEFMDQCITDPADSYLSQNIDGIYELAKHNFSKKSIQDFCLRVLHSGRISNAQLFGSEINGRAVDALREFVSQKNEILVRLTQNNEKLAGSSRYRDALKLIDKAESKDIKEMLQEVIDEYQIPIGFAEEQLKEHTQKMIKLLYGKESLEHDEAMEFERFVDKYCPTSFKY